MKAFIAAICLLFVVPAVFADELADRVASIPNPRRIDGGWVSDPAGIIANRKADINLLIANLEAETSAEIAVVVLPTIGHLIPKDFAVALVEKWGVGKKGKDNGVLVLHVLDQRRIEIETGYGMEGILPDAKCHWITEEIAVPFFKKNSFADGHYEVVRALTRAIRQPDIKHVDLISHLETQPGATVDRLPTIPSYDDISLKYASVTKRVVYGKWTPILLAALGGVLYLAIAFVYLLRSRAKEPHVRYALFGSGISRLQYLSALPIAASALTFEYSHIRTFFSPAPALVAVLLAILWRRSKVLKSLRDAPRICQCGKTMHRLSEQQDDAYLEKGNVAEEKIGSMDYDVWLCECGKSTVESYRGKRFAEPCVKCHYRTYRTSGSNIVKSATTVSTGLLEVAHTCANCGYKKIDTQIIPVIASAAASSSSGWSEGSSGGGSGGSFGGGSSGGGGAGSSY